jgi:DNA-binding transcriptional ArsR family regulator
VVGPKLVGMHKPEDFADCAARLKALADPDRLRIVNCLLGENKSVSQLAEELGEPIDKISHHLGVLRGARLVTTQRQGKFIIYSVDPEVAPRGETGKGVQLDLGCCRLDLE